MTIPKHYHVTTTLISNYLFFHSAEARHGWRYQANQTLHGEKFFSMNEAPFKSKSDGTVIITPHPRQLPNEILARIIHHIDETTQPAYILFGSRHPDQQRDLHACTLVNRQFYALANPLLWQELEFQ
ncbi:hypothetical protein BCR42DRAFT_457622 [Absidia repens]|uniref:F-box domain-containing protein n=1 Tax=Absidia repens TaxID=90262 RepID=A0A1X2H976_9FUNG|nr:hypothetical protein BCR42DRAFT_457622 [Absidia repens]